MKKIRLLVIVTFIISVLSMTGCGGGSGKTGEKSLILSRLVDTFFSKISLTMPPVPKPHNTCCVLA